MKIINFMTRSLFDDSVFIVCSVHEFKDGTHKVIMNYPPKDYGVKHFQQEIKNIGDWVDFLNTHQDGHIEELVRGKNTIIDVASWKSALDIIDNE